MVTIICEENGDSIDVWSAFAVIGLMVREVRISGVKDMLDHEVLFHRTWPGAYTALAISCGYFAYDQWDMIRKHLYSAKAPHLLVHHAVLLTCFTPALQRDLCINYLILTLICEVSELINTKISEHTRMFWSWSPISTVGLFVMILFI